MAETFGDTVYLRAELRADGTYMVVSPLDGTLVPIKDGVLPACDHLALSALDYVQHGWAGVSVSLLLLKGFEKYYLPRVWNPSVTWISWEDLKQMHDKFTEERERAS